MNLVELNWSSCYCFFYERNESRLIETMKIFEIAHHATHNVSMGAAVSLLKRWLPVSRMHLIYTSIASSANSFTDERMI